MCVAPRELDSMRGDWEGDVIFGRTEQDERLRVSTSGFLPGCEPDARCAGQEVLFDVRDEAGELEAVDVHFPTAAAPRRARLRHSR